MKTDWVKHSEKLMEDALQKQIERDQAREMEADVFAMGNMDPDADPLTYFLNKKRAR